MDLSHESDRELAPQGERGVIASNTAQILLAMATRF
jgi:hypothetical protein